MARDIEQLIPLIPLLPLAGAVVNTRLRHRKGKLWYTNRDIGSSFGVRFLASYYDYTFGDKVTMP